jgi:hypothetical protein
LYGVATLRSQYDFSPDAAPFFQCTFTLTTNNETTVATVGATKRNVMTHGDVYSVLCPRPVSIDKKSIFQLSLEWLGGTDAVCVHVLTFSEAMLLFVYAPLGFCWGSNISGSKILLEATRLLCV